MQNTQVTYNPACILRSPFFNSIYSMQQAPGPRDSPQVDAPGPQLGAALLLV